MNEVDDTSPRPVPEDEQNQVADQVTEDTEFEMPVPPATFEFLVISLQAQAQMQMGLMHFGPADRQPKHNLEIARHSIDMMGVLHEKTKGNLSLEEKRLLENSLTELRFRYVQAKEKESAPK